MMKKQETLYVLTGVGLGVAGLLAFFATRSAGPVKLTQFTELRQGPLQEHLVTAEELGFVTAAPRHAYPVLVAPGITACIAKGFAPLYQLPDPQAAALPAEAAW